MTQANSNSKMKSEYHIFIKVLVQVVQNNFNSSTILVQFDFAYGRFQRP